LSDPYTFTAHGHPWVVQSWLVSAAYGVADKVWGLDGVRLLMGLLTVGVLIVAWRLARPTQSMLVKLGIGALVLGVGAEQWSGRPLLVGLLALGLTVLAGEGDLDPRWLLPIGWLWVNSHGSFPLGLAYLLVAALGRRLDDLDSSIELRAFRWLVLGTLVGAVNPLGPRLLTFPIDLLRKQDLLHHVIEWQAPGFRTAGQRFFLIEVVVAILAVARLRRFRSALIVAVFLVASLMASRNIAVASIVWVPILATAWPSVGQLRTTAKSPFASAIGGLSIAAFLVIAIVRIGQPGLALDAYPVRSIRYLERQHVDLTLVRMATVDVVGNYLELRDGAGRRVFFDDRFDMFPEQVAADEFALVDGRPTSVRILDKWSADLVLWPDTLPLTSILEATGHWRTLYDKDQGWVLLCRRGATLSRPLGTC
jgi:hypothetical protein